MLSFIRRLWRRLFAYVARPLVPEPAIVMPGARVERAAGALRTPYEAPARPGFLGTDAVSRPTPAQGISLDAKRWISPGAAPTGRESAHRGLRRAAVLDVFDQLGLQFVPSACWPFIDSDDDIATGLGHFFEALGLSPTKLQARDVDEIDRADTILEFVVEAQQSFSRLDVSVVERIADRMLSGDYAAVRAAARATASMEKLARTADRWGPDARLAIFSEFLHQVEEGLRDPLSLTEDDVADAEGVISDLLALMVRFDAAHQLHRQLAADLARIWPVDWTISAEADQLRNDMSAFEALVELLRREPNHGIAEVSAALDELERINAALDELHARAEAHASRGSARDGTRKGGGRKTGGRSTGGRGSGSSGRASTGSKPSLRDEALIFFGFTEGSNPSQQEIRGAYKKFLFKNHPDFGPPEEQVGRTAKTQKAIWLFKDVLSL